MAGCERTANSTDRTSTNRARGASPAVAEVVKAVAFWPAQAVRYQVSDGRGNASRVFRPAAGWQWSHSAPARLALRRYLPNRAWIWNPPLHSRRGN